MATSRTLSFARTESNINLLQFITFITTYSSHNMKFLAHNVERQISIYSRDILLSSFDGLSLSL